MIHPDEAVSTSENKWPLKLIKSFVFGDLVSDRNEKQTIKFSKNLHKKKFVDTKELFVLFFHLVKSCTKILMIQKIATLYR